MNRRPARRVWRYVFALLMAIWVLGPFYFLLLVAVQSEADALRTPPVWLPKPDFSNFTTILSRAFDSGPAANPSDLIMPGLRNSAIVAVCVALANVVLGSAAGYAFARYRFPGSRTLPLALLGSQMVPAFALLIPFYTVLRNLALTNTLTGVIIADISITLPFTVYLLRAYFAGVPPEVERAARIDGASRWRVFSRVALPLATPGLISAGLFAFMVAWNDFVFAVVLNNQQSGILLQPAIAGLYNVREQSFGLMAAGSLISALPTVVIAVVTQRYLVRGLLSGAGKG
ncbi:carbohydrate ABC transporter permease [Phytohabitans kaempferiae]|uniref:Carbohydrate ABC transporter permease n=1 Tax=Phytohabitans kaempferiae TaxID=1620943 RepID=A0ABV6M737_9ACTN